MSPIKTPTKTRRIAQKPFDPKPFDVGSVVEVEGREFSIQSRGPAPTSRWAVDSQGNWELVKMPLRSRGPEIVVTKDEGITYAAAAAEALARAEAIRSGVAVRGTHGTTTLHVSAECEQIGDAEIDPGYRMLRAAVDELATLKASRDLDTERRLAGRTLCSCIDAAVQTRPAAA